MFAVAPRLNKTWSTVNENCEVPTANMQNQWTGWQWQQMQTCEVQLTIASSMQLTLQQQITRASNSDRFTASKCKQGESPVPALHTSPANKVDHPCIRISERICVTLKLLESTLPYLQFQIDPKLFKRWELCKEALCTLGPQKKYKHDKLKNWTDVLTTCNWMP